MSSRAASGALFFWPGRSASEPCVRRKDSGGLSAASLLRGLGVCIYIYIYIYMCVCEGPRTSQQRELLVRPQHQSAGILAYLPCATAGRSLLASQAQAVGRNSGSAYVPPSNKLH